MHITRFYRLLKETKNKFRYLEEQEPGKWPLSDHLYVNKKLTGDGKPPNRIKVVVEVVADTT